MSWLSQLMNPGKGYDKAKDASNAYYDKAQQYSQPYTDAGTNANSQLEKFMQQLMSGDLQNDWSKNYSESDQAKRLETGAMDRGLNTAGSMGLAGSSAALNNIQDESTGIMQADKQKYMDDMMQKYLAGMGIATNKFNTGAATSNQMGQNAINQGTTNANLDFGKYNAGPNMIAGGAGGIMKLIQAYLSGGGSMMPTGA